MKILIVCNSAGGLHDFRGMLIQRLAREHEVKAIIPLLENGESDLKEQKLEELGCGLIRTPIDRRGINPIEDLGLMLRYFQILRREAPDLVITYTIKPNVYAGIICRLLGIPLAANITGLGTAFQKAGWLRTLVTNMYKASIRYAKVVFFENAENRQVIIAAGIIKPEQACLLNGAGVDLDKFQYIPYPSEEATAGFRFLFIGRVMREKGIDELFSAMQRLRHEGINCSLDVVGGFDEDYSEKIKECETQGWLRYHGEQPDVRPFIAKCHSFVLPSWHEGMANTNLECAASGRPVITSNIHGCLEAVEDGKTGLLTQRRNLDDLYQTMKKMAGLDNSTREAMGRAGRKRMEEVFDKRKVVETTVHELLKM